MRARLLFTLIGGMFVAAPAFGQVGDWQIEGSATAGALLDSKSTKDSSKLQEYRDLGNGVLTNFSVSGRNDQSWFDGFGENFGRNDQYLTLRGGTYDLFKINIYSDSLQHNFLSNGLTPFAGSGSNNLTATYPQPTPATWNTISIGYKRTDNGGHFEWQSLAPWYFRIDANQVKVDGSKIGSGALGTSPSNGFIDLAIPVQNKTSNVSFESGYTTGKMILSLSYLYSKFDNDFTTLSWNNPFFANNVDTTYLSPGNSYQRAAANATFRELPWRSTLATRYTWSVGRSDADLAQTALNGSSPNFFGPTDPNVNHFSGKIQNQTFTASLASNPSTKVDTRVYYNYYKRTNDSTQVVYSADSIVNCGGPCASDLYQFTKNDVGADAYWRVYPKNRIGAGWEYVKTTQNRTDYNDIQSNKYFVEWKNSALDDFTARAKYTYLQRRSDYLLGSAGVDANDPNYLERFTSRFDSSDLDRNEVKLLADWAPLPLLDVSLEANWKDNQYRDITLGRTADKRNELYLSASYGDASRLRVTAFGDVEHVSYDGSHRQIAVGTCPSTTGGVTASNCFDPNTPANSVAYNWSSDNKDRNWVLGLGADWPVMERLLLKGSVFYYETDGSADTVSQANFGSPLPINAYDNTKHTSFNLKAIYAYDKNWTLTLGYAFERWRYSDAGYNGYQYTVPFPGVANNASQSYLNGYLAFNNYNTNAVYLLATYKFDTIRR